MRTQAELDKYIEELDDNKFTIEHFEQLCAKLKNNTQVTHIDFGKLSLLEGGTGGRAGRALNSLLANNTTLTHLSLNDTQISAPDILPLAAGLAENSESALISLGLGGAKVNSGNAFDGCIESLFSINRLHHLDLCFAHAVNAITVKAIGLELKNNTTLKSLALPIINNDFAYIFQNLEKNTTLESLDMSKSSIDERGMEDLKTMLERNKSLTSLICRFMNSGDEPDFNHGLPILGLKHLLEGMKSNHSVTNLDLYGSVTSVENLNEICEFLKKNTHVKKINLGCNQITNDGIELIAVALQVNTTLTSLDLSSNQFNDLAVGKLEKALEKNYSLLELKLFEEESAAINTLLKRNKQQLDIITSIDEGINSLEENDEYEYRLKAYLDKAQKQLNANHPDKKTIIENINTKIEALSLKRPAGDDVLLSNNKLFKRS